MGKKAGVKKFDEGIAELEAVVKQLETGELALEDALAAFEAGIALVRTLNEKLSAAEARIEVLTRTDAGELQTRALEVEEE